MILILGDRNRREFTCVNGMADLLIRETVPGLILFARLQRTTPLYRGIIIIQQIISYYQYSLRRSLIVQYSIVQYSIGQYLLPSGLEPKFLGVVPQ